MTRVEINPHSIVHWSQQAVATEVNDEIVLMNLDRDRCYGLGSTGSEIWRRLSEPIEVSQLWLQLQAIYEGEASQIESDVLQTLNQLSTEGLIEVESSNSV